jgi:hypothetical protein
MTNDNQIEMLEETIDKGKAAKAAKKRNVAADKALLAVTMARIKARAAVEVARKAKIEKDGRVEALLAFNAKFSNGPEFDNNGDTLRVWAERVC